MKARDRQHGFFEEVSSIHGQDYPQQISKLVPLKSRASAYDIVSMSAVILADDANESWKRDGCSFQPDSFLVQIHPGVIYK
jgi:hypothetical protein